VAFPIRACGAKSRFEFGYDVAEYKKVIQAFSGDSRCDVDVGKRLRQNNLRSDNGLGRPGNEIRLANKVFSQESGRMESILTFF